MKMTREEFERRGIQGTYEDYLLTNCADCSKRSNCPHHDNFRRLSPAVGGLGLCYNFRRKNFYLWDYYEDYGHIGDYDTVEQARAAADKRFDETDGECRMTLFWWNTSTNHYEEICFH